MRTVFSRRDRVCYLHGGGVGSHCRRTAIDAPFAHAHAVVPADSYPRHASPDDLSPCFRPRLSRRRTDLDPVRCYTPHAYNKRVLSRAEAAASTTSLVGQRRLYTLYARVRLTTTCSRVTSAARTASAETYRRAVRILSARSGRNSPCRANRPKEQCCSFFGNITIYAFRGHVLRIRAGRLPRNPYYRIPGENRDFV